MLTAEDGFFRRFRFPDADLAEVLREIDVDRAVVDGSAPAAASPEIRAQALFQAGLDRSAEYGIGRQVHFLLHHRGRCYAEQDRIQDARDSLEQALTLRRQIGDPRFIASSQNALTDLTQP